MDYSLMTLGTQLTRIILPMISVLGVAGNSLNILVLSRPALYRYSCSRCFLALAGNNLIYSGVLLTCRTLMDGYQMNFVSQSIIVCKIYTYLGTLLSFFAPYFIILASIDRFCATSPSAKLRGLSNVKVMKRAILFTIILLGVFLSNVPILIDISSDGRRCRIADDTTYKQIYLFVQVSCFAIVPPLAMAMFGFMTIYNTTQYRAIRAAASRQRRTEVQLARMLLLQLGVHIFLNVPTSVTYLMFLLPSLYTPTILFYFLNTCFNFLFYLSYATAFILYFLSSRIYRQELMNFIQHMLKFRRRAVEVHPNTNTMTLVAAGKTQEVAMEQTRIE